MKKFLVCMGMAVLLIASCKPITEGNKDDENKKKVTVTVAHDANVKSVTPASFEVDKGSELTLEQAQANVQIVFNDSYELDKVLIGGESGTEWATGTKHKFDANTTVYIKSKQVTSGGGGSGTGFAMNADQKKAYDAFINSVVALASIMALEAGDVKASLDSWNENTAKSLNFKAVDKTPDQPVAQGTTKDILEKRLVPEAL